MNDIQVILKALSREREDLHQQLMQVDRIIKRVKDGSIDSPEPIKEIPIQVAPIKPKNVSPVMDIKIQVLRAFDLIGCACSLKQIQLEYQAISGNKYNVRETVRSLNKSTLVKIVKDKDATRGFIWVKTEWLENGVLADKYKPEGFDLLYKAENLLYE